MFFMNNRVAEKNIANEVGFLLSQGEIERCIQGYWKINHSIPNLEHYVFNCEDLIWTKGDIRDEVVGKTKKFKYIFDGSFNAKGEIKHYMKHDLEHSKTEKMIFQCDVIVELNHNLTEKGIVDFKLVSVEE